MLSFVIDWGSEVSVSQWTWWFDYAAIFDLVAAILLFVVSKWKLKGKMAKKTTHASEVLAVVAAIIWIIDVKLNHRLSALQQNASDAQISTLTNSLARAEYARNQAQISANNAILASGNATFQAEKLAGANAKIEELEAKNLPWRISPEQSNIVFQLLHPIPIKKELLQVTYTVSEERNDFAKDLISILKNAGFLVEEDAAGLAMTPFSERNGLSVVVNSSLHPQNAPAIQRALNGAKIECKWYGTAIVTNRIWFVVGKKPF